MGETVQYWYNYIKFHIKTVIKCAAIVLLESNFNKTTNERVFPGYKNNNCSLHQYCYQMTIILRQYRIEEIIKSIAR